MPIGTDIEVSGSGAWAPGPELEAEVGRERQRLDELGAELEAAYARNEELAARLERRAASWPRRAGARLPPALDSRAGVGLGSGLLPASPGPALPAALESPARGPAAPGSAAQARIDAGGAPSFARTCAEIVETGLRLFPVWNLVMLALRFLRIAWVEAKYGVELALHALGVRSDQPRRPHVEWRQEIVRALVDVTAAVSAPLFGGLALAGAVGHAALNASQTDPVNEGMGIRGGTSDVAGGWAQELLDGKDERYPDGEVRPRRHVRSGLRELAAETVELARGVAPAAVAEPPAAEPTLET